MDTSKLDKIRALLAKAESTTFPAEAEAFTAKAMELMIQYGIDEAMLASTSQVKEEISTKLVSIKNPYSKIKVDLLYVVARSQSCMSVAHPDYSGKSYSSATVVGYESDIERVELLFTSLLLQATGQVVRVRPSRHVGITTLSYRKAWFIGFLNEVYKRLTKIKQHVVEQSESTTPGTALVLADRDSIVKSRCSELFSDTKKIRRDRVVDTEAYDAGKKAGAAADLGQTRVSTERRSLVN